MLQTILASAMSFVATNIDDMLINMLFFAQAKSNKDSHAVIRGKYMGTGLLVAVSCIGAYGMQAFAEKHVWLLGFVPVALGIKEIMNSFKTTDDKDENIDFSKGPAVNTALVTVANGADNIGVYIPLFAGFDGKQLAVMAAVFIIMTGLWCFFGKKLADLPVFSSLLDRYKKILVPAVYILLGVYIIMG